MTDVLVDQPTQEPTRKIKAVRASGLAVTVLTALVTVVWGPDVLADVEEYLPVIAVGMTALATFVAGYMRREKL